MSLNRQVIPLAEAEKKALAIAKGHRALIQAVADLRPNDTGEYVRDYKEIDELLDQLYDPNQFRPSRSAECFADAGLPLPPTLQKTNLKTGEVTTIEPGQCRLTKHKGVEYQHTAKMSSSLLPPEPQHMTPFGMGGFISFGWDIDACDIKGERYVWDEDAGTWCQWLSPNPVQEDISDLPPLSSIEGLRAKNDKAVANKEVIEWNEILVGLPKRRLDFMAVHRDERDYRLRLYDAMIRAKARLKFDNDIPMLIISEQGVRVYSAAEREEDLKALQKEQQPNLAANHAGIFANTAVHKHENTQPKLAPRKPLSTL